MLNERWDDYDYHNNVKNNTLQWDDTEVTTERYPPYKFRKEVVVFKLQHLKRIIVLDNKLELPMSSILHVLDNLPLDPSSYIDTPRLRESEWVLRESNRKMLYHVKAPYLDGVAKFTDKYIFQASGLPAKLMKYRGELDGSFKIANTEKMLTPSANILNIVNHNPIFRSRVFGQMQYFKKVQLVLTHLVNTIESLSHMGKDQYVDITWGTDTHDKQSFVRTTKSLTVSTVRKPHDYTYIVLIHLLNFIIGDTKSDGETTSVFRHLSEQALKQTNLMFNIDGKYVVYNLHDLKSLGLPSKVHLAVINQMNMLAIAGRSSTERIEDHVPVTTNSVSKDDDATHVGTLTEVKVYTLPSKKADDMIVDVGEDTLEDTLDDEKTVDALDKIITKVNPFKYVTPTSKDMPAATEAKVAVNKVVGGKTMTAVIPGKVVEKATTEKEISTTDVKYISSNYLTELQRDTDSFIDGKDSLTPAQKERYKAISKRYANLTLGDKTLGEIMSKDVDISIEESILPESIGYLPDKSALKSSASELDKAYVAKSFERNLIGTLISFHKHGAFLVDIKKTKEVSQMSNVTHYSFQFEDINGKKSTIKATLPTPDYHGRFKLDGKTQVLKKQRINKPIVKIAEDKVSLTTNYNKARVVRNTSKAHSYLSFIDSFINDSEKATIDIVYGSCKVNGLLPYEYSSIATKYRSLSFNDGTGQFWKLNFDYLARIEAFADHRGNVDKLDELEAEYGTYLGRSATHFYFINNQNRLTPLTEGYSELVKDEGLPETIWDILKKSLKPGVKANKQLTEWVDFVYLSNTFPLIFVLAYRYGLKDMLDYLGVDYTITDGRSKSIRGGRIEREVAPTTESMVFEEIKIMVKVAGKLNPSEISQLTKLEKLMSDDQNKHISPEARRIFKSIGETNVNTMDTLPPAQYVFAKDGETIVGFLEFNIADKVMELHQLYLNPKYRGRSIGGKLMDEALNIATSRNATSVELGVYSGNTLAKNMYVRRGFTTTTTRVLLFKKDVPSNTNILPYTKVSEDKRDITVDIGSTRVSYGMQKDKVIWVSPLQVDLSDLMVISTTLFENHPKAAMLLYAHDGILPDLKSPWIRYSEVMSAPIDVLRKKDQMHIESLMVSGIDDDVDVHLESLMPPEYQHAINTGKIRDKITDSEYLYFNSGEENIPEKYKDTISDIHASWVDKIKKHHPFETSLLEKCPTNKAALYMEDCEYYVVVHKNKDKVVALQSYYLIHAHSMLQLGYFYQDESYTGLNIERHILSNLTRFGRWTNEYIHEHGRVVPSCRTAMASGVMCGFSSDKLMNVELYKRHGFVPDTKRITIDASILMDRMEAPILSCVNHRGTPNMAFHEIDGTIRVGVSRSRALLGEGVLGVMHFNGSDLPRINSIAATLISHYSDEYDIKLVIVRLTEESASIDPPIPWKVFSASFVNNGCNVDTYMESLATGYLSGLELAKKSISQVKKILSSIKTPLFDNTRSVTPGLMDVVWDFFSGKEKEELYLDKIISMLMATTASGSKLSAGDIEKEFIKFVKPHLWKNELIYTKDAFIADWKTHCPDMKLPTEDDVYDYLVAPGMCWIGADIEHDVNEAILEYGDEYPCWASLAKYWIGKIRYNLPIIVPMLQDIGATVDTVRLYAVAVLSHERAHTVQFGYPRNDSTDVYDSSYDKHISERDANACSYYAMRIYRDTGKFDTNMHKIRIDKITTYRHPLLSRKYKEAYDEFHKAMVHLPSSSSEVYRSLKLDTKSRDEFISGCKSDVILYTSHYSESELRDKIWKNIPLIDMGNDVYLRVYLEGRSIGIAVTKYYGDTDELHSESMIDVYTESMGDIYTEQLHDYVPRIPRPHKSKYYYHITLDDHGDEKLFTPRIPKVMISSWENGDIPRICVSSSIEGCILGNPYIFVHPDRAKEDPRFRTKTARCNVYAISKDLIPETAIISNQRIVDEELVFDAHVTDEVWITSEITMTRIGKIVVSNTKDSEEIRFNYKHGDSSGDMNTWLFPYKWTEGPTIDIGDGTVSGEVYDEIYSTVGKVEYALLNTEGMDITDESNEEYVSTNCLLLGAKALLAEENPKGTCYDQAIAVSYLLTEKGYTTHKTAFAQYNNATHLVTYIPSNGKYTIIETAWWDKRGIHEVSSLVEHFTKVGSNLISIDCNVDVMKFYDSTRFTHEDLLKTITDIPISEYRDPPVEAYKLLANATPTKRFFNKTDFEQYDGRARSIDRVAYLDSLDLLGLHPEEYCIGASGALALYRYPSFNSDLDIVVFYQGTIDKLLEQGLIIKGDQDGIHDEMYQSADGNVDISIIGKGHIDWDTDTFLSRSSVVDGYRFLTWSGLYVFYKELYVALGKEKHLAKIAWMDEQDETLSKRNKIAPKYKPKSNDIRISFKDCVLWINRYPTMGSLIVAGLDSFDLSKYDFDELNSKDAYHRLMADKRKSANYLKGIDSFFDLFIDNIAYTDLALMGEPTNTRGLLVRAAHMLTTLEHLPASSAVNHKIRGYEQINAVVYNEMARQFAGYQSRRTKANVFSVSPDAIYLRIVKNSALVPSDAVNPIQDLKESTYLTHAGIGGRTSESFVIEDRKFTEGDVGIISEATPDNAKVAISAHITMDPIVANTTGITESKPVSELQPANVLSPAALIFPFSVHDD